MSLKRASSAQPFLFHGLSIRELTPEQLTSASVADIVVPAGEAHPRARSWKSDKLYIALEGQVSFDLEGETAELAAGDTLAIATGRWFQYSNPGPRPARMLLVHIPPFDLDAEEFGQAP